MLINLNETQTWSVVSQYKATMQALNRFYKHKEKSI